MSASDPSETADPQHSAATTIYVCITCRRRDDQGVAIDSEPRHGAQLAADTAQAAHGTGIAVREVKCLGNCNRGPSAAMRSNGSWTYVFGDLDIANGATLIEGARLLAGAGDGILPWRGRPEQLKRGLIARIPPIGFVLEDK